MIVATPNVAGVAIIPESVELVPSFSGRATIWDDRMWERSELLKVSRIWEIGLCRLEPGLRLFERGVDETTAAEEQKIKINAI